MSINHFESNFLDSKGDDFLNIGVTDPLKPFLVKFFHWGTLQGPPKLKKSHFSKFKIFEKRQFLASNPLETMNIDMRNHIGGLEITLPPSDPLKNLLF